MTVIADNRLRKWEDMKMLWEAKTVKYEGDNYTYESEHLECPQIPSQKDWKCK